MQKLLRIINNYSQFLDIAGEFQDNALKKHGLRCRRGCHDCCSSGLIDITPLDAVLIRKRLGELPSIAREKIVKASEEQLALLAKKGAFSLRHPFLQSEKAVDTLFRRTLKMDCPALENGHCLIYPMRPLLCRLCGPTVRGDRRSILLQGCGRFKRDIPDADFPVSGITSDEEIPPRFLQSSRTKAHVICSYCYSRCHCSRSQEIFLLTLGSAIRPFIF